MNTISKILTGNLFWIIFFLFVVTSAQARNEYLNDGAYACERGHWETYTEVRQHEYKSGTSDEYQDQTLGFRFRMPFGAVCDDEYIAEQKKKQKLKELKKIGFKYSNIIDRKKKNWKKESIPKDFINFG